MALLLAPRLAPPLALGLGLSLSLGLRLGLLRLLLRDQPEDVPGRLLGARHAHAQRVHGGQVAPRCRRPRLGRLRVQRQGPPLAVG